jgi:hypothetical protein
MSVLLQSVQTQGAALAPLVIGREWSDGPVADIVEKAEPLLNDIRRLMAEVATSSITPVGPDGAVFREACRVEKDLANWLLVVKQLREPTNGSRSDGLEKKAKRYTIELGNQLLTWWTEDWRKPLEDERLDP